LRNGDAMISLYLILIHSAHSACPGSTIDNLQGSL
jgi:hypothetical protein